MAQYTSPVEPGWIQRHVIAFIGVAILAVLVVIAGFQEWMTPFAIWISLLVLFLIASLIVSHAFTRRWLGILIDERNKYSLSRFQMLLWTMMILSAFLAAVLANIQLRLLVTINVSDAPPAMVVSEPSGSLVGDALLDAGIIQEDPNTGALIPAPDLNVDLSQVNLAAPLRDGQIIEVPKQGEILSPVASPEGGDSSATSNSPLSVQIPTEVWLLLGISTTSLVASPLIKGQKPDAIVRNQSASEAKLADMFRGEENSNFNLLDLGKVQMLYVTLIVIGGYAIAVAYVFLRTQSFVASLPALDGGVVAMLGVSHAGYLSNKAISRGNGTNIAAAASTAPPQAPPETPPESDQSGVG